MQRKYQLSPEELNMKFVRNVKKAFRKDDEVILILRDKGSPITMQSEMFFKSEALQRKFPPLRIAEDIDLSKLADHNNPLE